MSGQPVTVGGPPRLSLWALLRSLRHHRSLGLQLVRRDVASRYQGSVMGLLWSLVTPLLMLAVYLYVFGFVFAPLRPAPGTSLATFALGLFAGMLAHALLADCLIRSVQVIVSQPSYVKKIVFPVELLPLTVVGSALVQFAIGWGVLLVATAWVQGLSPAILWLPVMVLPLVLVSAGVALGIAALGVYLRDIAQVTGLVATVLMFLSPVFYPLESLAPNMQFWMKFNPLTFPIEACRGLLLKATPPDWSAWGLYTLAAVGVLWLGWAAFEALRRGFADVL